MSKRKMKSEENQHVAKRARHWTLALLDSMKDPDSIYKDTERIVVIRDKYPKAKIHYLVLPKDNINSIHKLTREHLPLIEEFGALFKSIQTEHKNHLLNAGFHAMPSMQRLHMHIISNDMDSSCLKNKVHWNSFTTTFLKPIDDVVKELKEYGFIKKLSSDDYKKLMTTPLKCNQCSFVPKNMPQLKEHLRSHLINNN